MLAVQKAIPYAHVVQGIFPASARYAHPDDPISFVHLDCDQEESYRDAIGYLRTRMAKGGVMWFDDAPCLAGAKLAVQVFFKPEVMNHTQGKWWVRF